MERVFLMSDSSLTTLTTLGVAQALYCFIVGGGHYIVGARRCLTIRCLNMAVHDLGGRYVIAIGSASVADGDGGGDGVLDGSAPLRALPPDFQCRSRS